MGDQMGDHFGKGSTAVESVDHNTMPRMSWSGSSMERGNPWTAFRSRATTRGLLTR